MNQVIEYYHLGDLVSQILGQQVSELGFESQQLAMYWCSLYLIYIQTVQQIISKLLTYQDYGVSSRIGQSTTIVTSKQGSHNSHPLYPFFDYQKKKNQVIECSSSSNQTPSQRKRSKEPSWHRQIPLIQSEFRASQLGKKIFKTDQFNL